MTIKIRKPFDGFYPVTFKFGEAPAWYTKKYGYPHNGNDFGMPIGVPILACDDGIVTYADDVPDADGKGINITHANGMSQYWHLSLLMVNEGDKVTRGQQIGLSGNTGYSTGPHLHFGYKYAPLAVSGMKNWIDPSLYFAETTIVAAATPVVNKTYTVEAGDTLWSIANKFYGKGWLWRKIFDANDTHIENPDIIRVGQALIIP
ncbi:MAG: peptidoglycan DD-metalloendopeptidase family protein [Bacteroidales bacterium]